MSLQFKEARVRPQAKPCKICGRQSGNGAGFCPSISVLPCQFHSTNALYSSSFTCYSYHDKRAKPGNPKDFPTAYMFCNWNPEREYLYYIRRNNTISVTIVAYPAIYEQHYSTIDTCLYNCAVRNVCISPLSSLTHHIL